MPFLPQHKHYLEAMGLVPWVCRDANTNDSCSNLQPVASTNEPDPTPSINAAVETAFDRRTVQDSIYLEQTALVHGDAAASLLLVFDEQFGHSSVLLDAKDNQLLRDMLQAIQLSESSVARCLLAVNQAQPDNAALSKQVGPSIQAVLHLVGQSDHIHSDDELSSRLATPNLSVPAWCLPHPAWIQQQPSLKRRAWNVLKAVKAALHSQSHR